jgi:hypothetical protein
MWNFWSTRLRSIIRNREPKYEPRRVVGHVAMKPINITREESKISEFTEK